MAIVGTGFCGGYTTFSTAMVDAVRLAREQRAGAAVVSVLGTVLWSLLAVAAGAALIGLALGRRKVVLANGVLAIAATDDSTPCNSPCWSSPG